MKDYHDEIMEGVMQRKAEINKKYPTFEALDRHYTEVEARMRKEGWTFIDPIEFREQNLRRQLAENI
jgi:hypothetical protein